MSYDKHHHDHRQSLRDQILVRYHAQEEEGELSFLIGCPEPKRQPETD